MSEHGDELERSIAQWRQFLRRRQAIHAVDVEELEDHLRDQVATLVDAGLSADEAFLVAVKRMGDLDELSREFAREYSERLWKQLVMAPSTGTESRAGTRTEASVVFCLAVIAALAVKVPELFGRQLNGGDAGFYARNLGLFVLPVLTGYFAWKRRLDGVSRLWLALPFVAGAVFANAFPFTLGGATEVLTALHLPIALWLAVGIAYAGGHWSIGGGRMDFVRFSGELFIYYTLIALGGGVLTGFTLGMFNSIGLDVEWLAEAWVLPCGAVGAVIVGSWLVEAKQSVVENMAPVLTRLFTPLFAAVLLAFLATMAWTGSGIGVEREVLIGFDLLLVLVLGLLLYAVSARDPQAQPNAFDALQLVLVVSALVVDVVALAAIAARISEFGFSPNRWQLSERISSCCSTSRGRPGSTRVSSVDTARSLPWSDGRLPTCRSMRYGKGLSWSSFRRCSDTSSSPWWKSELGIDTIDPSYYTVVHGYGQTSPGAAGVDVDSRKRPAPERGAPVLSATESRAR